MLHIYDVSLADGAGEGGEAAIEAVVGVHVAVVELLVGDGDSEAAESAASLRAARSR